MALKKPSDYFKKNEEISSIDNGIQKTANNSEIETFSDAFFAFKNNLSKIEVLSEFSGTLDDYNTNIENVKYLSETVNDIQKELKNLLKKEDLDRAMMSQLIVVEQTIRDLQDRVKGINEESLIEISLNVSDLTNSINEFFETEVPKYKRLILDSEIRGTNKFEKLEESVNKSIGNISEFVNEKYIELTESLEGINEKNLSDILEDFKILENNLKKIQEEDIPKYKGFIVKTEKKIEDKLNQFDEKFLTSIDNYQKDLTENIEQKYSHILDNYNNLENIVVDLKDNQIPNYNHFIVESQIKVDSTIEQFNSNLNKVTEKVLEKVNEVENISVNNEELASQVTQKIDDVKKLNNKVVENLRNNENYKTALNQKLNDLNVEIVRNEFHIKNQTKKLEKLQEEVKENLGKINLEDIEEKNHKLGEKIRYLEEIFQKFSEKEIITENLLTEPPSTDNKDTLTPLDQNYVTLDQLQKHYRLFINRIQQQLATIGGGGETQLKYLDDVVGIATNAAAYHNKFLKYNHSLGKFEFDSVDISIDSWDAGDYGPYTYANIGIGTSSSTSQISVGSVYGFDTSVIGVTTTDTFTINIFSSDIFRSARFQIQITQGTDYQTTDLLTIHNGTTVSLIEYGSVATSDYLASFSSIIVGNDALLQVNMTKEDYAEIKVVSQKITI